MVRKVAKIFVKNIAGYALLAAGAILCLPMVPGPGLLLVFAGLALADWPGKASFFRWLHSFEWFAKIDDWFHGKFGVRMPERDYWRSVNLSKLRQPIPREES